MGEIFWRGLILGAAGTIAMDLWALALYRFFGQNKPNWAPAGRWFRAVTCGRVFHGDISELESHPGETSWGWAGHYIVGLAYGVIFAFLVGSQWFAAPTFVPALIFGIVTVGAGWFFMQPGMGLGIAASRTANPNKVRLLNLAAHVIFALGFYVAALLLRGF